MHMITVHMLIIYITISSRATTTSLVRVSLWRLGSVHSGPTLPSYTPGTDILQFKHQGVYILPLSWFFLCLSFLLIFFVITPIYSSFNFLLLPFLSQRLYFISNFSSFLFSQKLPLFSSFSCNFIPPIFQYSLLFPSFFPL